MRIALKELIFSFKLKTLAELQRDEKSEAYNKGRKDDNMVAVFYCRNSVEQFCFFLWRECIPLTMKESEL